ncbi:MAG: hypothetical protein EXR79_01520 [Myxococcales bacterium]|nr:hypothetical protein [Myxococcales bacterium]
MFVRLVTMVSALALAAACSGLEPGQGAGATGPGNQTAGGGVGDGAGGPGAGTVGGAADAGANNGAAVDGAATNPDGAADDAGAADLASASDVATGADTSSGPDVAVPPDAIGGDATAPDTKADAKADAGSAKEEYKELLVKVLGPSGREWVQNEGANVQISGLAFGSPTSIDWKTLKGQAGTITAAQFWVSGIIPLDQGDNVVTVTAKKGDQIAIDTVRITYNPFFSFEGNPDVAPDLLFVGESAKLVVHMPVAAAQAGIGGGNNVVDPNTITLVEVDANGKEIKDWGKLVDNGQVGQCDDVPKDSVYSSCLTAKIDVPKTLYFRVRAKVSVFEKVYDALSPVTVVDVVERFNKQECTQIVSLQQKVKADYLAAVEAQGAAAAQAAALAALKADPAVAEAGPAANGGYSIWVRYKTGRLGALNLAPKGVRGGGGAPGASPDADSGGPGPAAALPTFSVGTRRALALAPFAAEFTTSKCAATAATCDPGCAKGFLCGAAGNCAPASNGCEAPCGADQACVIDVGDEADLAGKLLKARECPPFAVDSAAGSNALLRWYRDMSSYGAVAITGHGDVLFEGMDAAAKATLGWEHLGAQEVLWSGEASDCKELSGTTAGCNQAGAGCPKGESCVKTSMSTGVCVDKTQGDIMKGRVAIGDSTYALLPSFVQRHGNDPFPQSIVYLGACRTMYNGSLAVQLYGNGAQAVVGFSDYVSNKFAFEKGWKLFQGLIAGNLGVYEAHDPSFEDPQYGGRMRLMGNGKANAKESAIINPSWDLGKLIGWKAVGDGRVISRLGVTIPVAGKFMGIISTGLGFTAQNGSLEQPFCIGPGKTELCYFWKFYSEEFIEWCGSQFMDRFTVTLMAETQNKKLTMTDVWIDELCPYDCGGKKPCQPGDPACQCGKQWKTLTQADLSFDQGGVYMTPWQKQCADISTLAGSNLKVNLSFFATDKGDSIFDTAVLIDEVTVQ